MPSYNTVDMIFANIPREDLVYIISRMDLSYKLLKDCGTCIAEVDDRICGEHFSLHFALEMISHKWILRNEIIIYDDIDGKDKTCFTLNYKKVFFFVKQKKYFFNTQYEKYTKPLGRWGGDFIKEDGNSTWDAGTGQNTTRKRNVRPNKEGKIRRSVWDSNAHPYHIISDACCPAGGRVVYPFYKVNNEYIYYGVVYDKES